VRATGGLDQSVRHQRTGRDDGFHNPAIDQFRDDQSLLRNGHRPSQRHHDKAIFIERHRLKHISALADLSSGERRAAHRPNQIVYAVDLGEIQRFQRHQLVRDRIVEYAFDTFALIVLVLVAQNSPRGLAGAPLRREKFEVLKMYK
jgi:hypothetical protein